MNDITHLPDVPSEQIGSAEHGIRYEDIAQDGRLRIEGVWAPMGRILWSQLSVAKVLARLAEEGIRNVLARVVIDARDEPISLHARARSEVRYELAHTLDSGGQVNRILLLTHLTTRAPRGVRGRHTVPPTGEWVVAARAFGQHVFTRPAAPAGQHRVLALEDPALPSVPEKRVELSAPDRVLDLPEGARWLEAAPRADAMLLVFGLAHTDGNQHVNFMAYPRLVEDSALRRLDELGIDGRMLARRVEVTYKKPCFAGDRVRLVSRAFARGDRVGVCAAFLAHAPGVAADDWSAQGLARCFVRMELAR